MLKYTIIDNKKVILLPEMLERVLAAKADIEAAGMTLELQGESTCSWRTNETQQQLVDKGVSWTLLSNHRRGTAIDVMADWDYIGKIEQIMYKHGLVNDLRQYGDGGHFNLLSNTHAGSYPIINELPANIPEFNMNQYEDNIIWETETTGPGSGRMAYIQNNLRREVTQERAGLASLALQAAGGKVVAVNKEIWDSFEEGESF